MAFRFTPLAANHDDLATHSRKRPGSPPLSPANKRHRSVEMSSVSDGMSLSTGMLRCTFGRFAIYFIFAGTPMSTSTTETPMSISGLSATIAGLRSLIDYPTAASTAPSPAAAVLANYGDSALGSPGPGASECSPLSATSPPSFTSAPVSSAASECSPLSAASPPSFTFPAPVFPFVEQDIPIWRRSRPVSELMERAESPPAMPSSPAILPGAAVPSQARAPGSRPSSVPPKVESADNHHTSLFSADGADDTSTVVPTGSPSSDSSLYTDFNGTPPPDEVAGLIQGLNRYELLEVVCPETLREWEAVSGPKVIIFIANDTVTNEIHHRVTLIRKALMVIFPDIDPVIGSAAVSGIADVTQEPVFPFLIHQIPQSYAHRLILQHSWTINGFSFFALRFALPVTRHAMTLVGLHLPARLESNDIVATLVRRWLRNSHSVNSFIRDHHDALPTFMAVDEQIEFALSTVEITHVKLGNEDDSAVAFNAYIHPPTSDALLHRSWLQAVQAITYYADCGTGKAVSIFRCNVCKGRDHSSDSCPFPANQSFKTSTGIETGTLPIADSGCNKYEGGDRGLSVNGINFNYFMH